MSPLRRAEIETRLASLYVELADARLALDRCPESERPSIAQRIVEVREEIRRGMELVRASSAEASSPAASTRMVRTGQTRAEAGPTCQPTASGEPNPLVGSKPEVRGAASFRTSGYLEKVT